MHQRRLIKIAAPLVIGALALTACGSDEDPPTDTEKKSYTLAFMGPLSGSDAALGKNMLNGVKVAIDEANKDASLGFTVKLEEFDDEGNENKGQPVAQSVVDDTGIIGVVGPAFSGVTVNAGDVFSNAKMLFVSPSASRTSLTTEGFTTFGRLVAPDSAQGPEGANYVVKGLKATKVYAVSDKSEYGQGLVDEFVAQAKTNGADVKTEGVPAKTTNYGPIITKIKNAGSDAVYYGGYYSDAGLFLKQLRAQGITAKFISGDGSNDDQLISGAGAAAAEGAYLTCGCGDPTTDPNAAGFVTAYKALNSADPGAYSAEAYDAAKAIIAGIKSLGADVTREKLATAVLKGSYQGLTKLVKFDDKGEVATRTIFVYQVTAGKRKVIGTTAELGK